MAVDDTKWHENGTCKSHAICVTISSDTSISIANQANSMTTVDTVVIGGDGGGKPRTTLPGRCHTLPLADSCIVKTKENVCVAQMFILTFNTRD